MSTNTVAVNLSTEVLANSLGATGGALTIVSNTFQVNCAAVGNSNGSVFRVSVAGVNPAIVFGSENIATGTVLSVAIGPNGNAADPVLLTANVPPNPATGAWAAEFLCTMRANSAGQGANANTVWSVAGLFPTIPGLVGTAIPAGVLLSAPTANGVANVKLSGTANLCNITILAACNTGQNANSLVELCAVAAVV